MLSIGFYNWTLPFFGTLLTGSSGAIVAIVLLLILLWTARGIYKLDSKAWWVAVLIFLCWFVSTAVTFLRVNMQDYYGKMGYSEQQVEDINQCGNFFTSNMAIMMGISFAVLLIYLFCIKKYFVKELLQEDLSQTPEQI